MSRLQTSFTIPLGGKKTTRSQTVVYLFCAGDATKTNKNQFICIYISILKFSQSFFYTAKPFELDLHIIPNIYETCSKNTSQKITVEQVVCPRKNIPELHIEEECSCVLHLDKHKLAVCFQYCRYY